MARFEVVRRCTMLIEADSEADAIQTALAYPASEWNEDTFASRLEEAPEVNKWRDRRYWGNSYAKGYRR